jgi:RsiW-degrading membrane proteinase PrsW (M82 family)
MRRRRRIEAILFGILIPVLFLVWFYGKRFKRLPEWSRDAYPYVLWFLVGITVVVAVIYVVYLASDFMSQIQGSGESTRPDDKV